MLTEAERVQLAAVAESVANHGSALDENVRLLAEKVPALVREADERYDRLAGALGWAPHLSFGPGTIAKRLIRARDELDAITDRPMRTTSSRGDDSLVTP